ncbi:MAG: hypothetical protein DRQ08_05695 [Candidatus Latescibacterota bacterium]|nr:MAG: hypothetical protein DRQ08_05695 [Candidatus Latescibacterota bacterium]
MEERMEGSYPTPDEGRWKDMARTIDVEGLSEEQVKLVEEFVEFLKSKKKVHPAEESQEDVTFRSWPLGVKGKITREEIYDHL